MGADWLCGVLENAKNCLFKQRNITGNGNYTVGIRQDGVLKRIFVMADSNGSGGMSAESKANGHSKAAYGFGADQIEWYTEGLIRTKNYADDVKITFAYHAPIAAYEEAFAKYGYDGANFTTINIDELGNKEDGDFGYFGGVVGNWDTDKTVYNGLKALGVDSMLTGHVHSTNASVVYEGIRFRLGNKMGTYDSTNYRKDDGSIVHDYLDCGFPLVGGTVMTVSNADGTINNAYHYYCTEE